MFYLPFELRNQTQYATPKGPSFKWAPRVNITVDGTEIHLRAPRHRTMSPVEQHYPHSTYSNLEHLNLGVHSMGRPEWRYLPLIYRVWDFYGPWFTGCLSSVDATLSIITPEKMKKTNSFFHPRAFESGIADYLTYCFGQEISDGKQRWIAPDNWQPISRLPFNAVSFDVVENRAQGFDTGRMGRYICMALTNHHLLLMDFKFSQNIFFQNHVSQEKNLMNG